MAQWRFPAASTGVSQNPTPVHEPAQTPGVAHVHSVVVGQSW
jgi:hypothetical protein